MNLSWWQGLVLGLVQGLTEFLPISSSGHLVLAETLVGFEPQGVVFEVIVHIATLLSVFIAYRRRIGELVRGLFARQAAAWSYALFLVVATVPAAVIGLLFRDALEASFHSGVRLGLQFLFTAVVLYSTRFAVKRAGTAAMTTGRSLWIGAAQAVAIIPGISRSGTTIAAALWVGIAPAVAAEFSFLMAIVVIAGTGVLELRHLTPDAAVLGPGLLWAFVSALLAGIVAIKFLVALLRSSRFHLFAPYCAVLGVFCLIWFGWLGR
ncbi:MAG: undecaprenyl-diphosphate phosphatase [Gemmatimonadales bacterium]